MIMPMDPDAHPSRPLREPQPPVGYGGGGVPLVESMAVHDRPRFTRGGNPIVSPDPGTPTSRLLAIVAAILLAGVAIAWQNIGHDRQQQLVKAPPVLSAEQAADQPAPAGMMTDPMARMFLRLRNIMAQGTEKDRKDLVVQIDGTVTNDADRVRAIIFAAEYIDHAEALRRIEQLRGSLPNQEDTPIDAEQTADAANRALIRAELDTLETIYTTGPDALDAPARDQLSARYGTLGDFALSTGKSESDRNAVIGGPLGVILLGLFVICLLGFGLLAGFALLVYGMVWYFNPRRVMRGEKPTPGGSVMLETYALFVGGFAVLSIGSTLIVAHGSEQARNVMVTLHLPAQWLLMLTVLWPLIRGMAPTDWRRAMGLTRGQGVWREIGCGLLAYLASVPLFMAGVLVNFILMTLWNWYQSGGGDGPIAPPENPIMDLVGSGDLIVLILVFTLATIWAPITEELIFRGALFRHLRGRLHWTVAALFSAVLFAYLHSYGPLMVAPLIALGFMFAFMREWRGSIIAPMTAHFLHNFTVLTMIILALQVVA